jgi:prepilin-type N-terminal cleavage/methylation domain-containing protein
MTKQKIKKEAFTLVELIVVITILAILWTIAFISL